MKIFYICLILSLTLALESKAESDTLIIHLKDGTSEKIDISQIQKIKFENITAVNEQNKPASTLVATGNYPNPFGELTSIEFEIAIPGNVEIIIYDVAGNQIQKLECSGCQAGKNTLQWNCIDKNNTKVQSGAYYYEVRFGNEVQGKKMIELGGNLKIFSRNILDIS